MEEKRPSVFISYASEDFVFAALVKSKLDIANIDVWMDQDRLSAGEEWRDGIDLGITDSDALIVILTPESCGSPYVTYEWAFALGKKKKVLPILYKKKDADIHPRLTVLHYLDFTNPQKGPWDQLLKLVQKASDDNKQNNQPSTLVGGTPVDELKQMLLGVLSLANATAKNERRDTSQGDILEAAANIAQANGKLSQFDAKLKTILWVDDWPDNNTHERGALSSLGFTFDIALSTNEALQKLASNTYSAIISDMARAEGAREGYVLLEKVRKSGNAIPYFIYAGSNLPAHKQEAAQRGAQGTTNNPRELIELITQYT